ncbi:MAG: glutamate-5-semialdehyde dehydrogenase [bacterium]
METKEIAKRARAASYKLLSLSSKEKDSILLKIASVFSEKKEDLLKENERDLEYGKQIGLSNALMDRLLLNEKRISDIASGIKAVALLPDPVFEIYDMTRRPNGMLVGKMRHPLGVIGIIYEARPNVTLDAFSLCFKSSNSVILKGGSEALNSNKFIVKVIKDVLSESNLGDAIGFVEEREGVKELASLKEYIDCIILRGGKRLISEIGEGAKVPIISHGEGICHTYIDNEADLKMAEEIAYNAKVQRPGVCNAMETLLVHSDIARDILPNLIKKLKDAGCEIRGDERVGEIVKDIIPATEEDWKTEYLSLILSIKIIDSLDEAISHINHYGSHHSDSIVTNSYSKALRFLKEIDSASVYVNVSTRFTDGFEFGMGAEIGTSTQKLHARGPMGLKELTSSKFIILGEGQIRK